MFPLTEVWTHSFIVFYITNYTYSSFVISMPAQVTLPTKRIGGIVSCHWDHPCHEYLWLVYKNERAYKTSKKKKHTTLILLLLTPDPPILHFHGRTCAQIVLGVPHNAMTPPSNFPPSMSVPFSQAVHPPTADRSIRSELCSPSGGYGRLWLRHKQNLGC